MTAVVIGAATGILSGFGIGGGSLLILWLTMVQQLPKSPVRTTALARSITSWSSRWLMVPPGSFSSIPRIV